MALPERLLAALLSVLPAVRPKAAPSCPGLLFFRLRRCRLLPSFLRDLGQAAIVLHLRLRVGDVAEHLHPSQKLLAGEHPVLLVDGDARQRLELPRQPAKSADDQTQIPLRSEYLQPVHIGVGHPNVAIAINGNALGAREFAGAVAVLAERTNERALGIKLFHPVIERVADVEVAVFVYRHVGRGGKITGIGKGTVLASSPNLAQQLERISIENQHLIRSRVRHIKKTVLFVDGKPGGIVHHAFAELAFQFVLGIENQHVIVLTVREKASRHHQWPGPKSRQLRVHTMLDKPSVFALRVENEDCSHLGIGHVQHTLGIDRQPVGSSESEARFGAGTFGSIIRAHAGHACHSTISF